jgi:plastocyanin
MVTIHAGDTVQWVWQSPGHTVTSGTVTATAVTPDNKFCSPSDTNCGTAPLSNTGDMYSHTFSQPGMFPYYCRPHAHFGMTGTVVVQ